jgi:hypothetical protein
VQPDSDRRPVAHLGVGRRWRSLRRRQPVSPPRVGGTAQAWCRLRACSPLANRSGASCRTSLLLSLIAAGQRLGVDNLHFNVIEHLRVLNPRESGQALGVSARLPEDHRQLLRRRRQVGGAAHGALESAQLEPGSEPTLCRCKPFIYFIRFSRRAASCYAACHV